MRPLDCESVMIARPGRHCNRVTQNPCMGKPRMSINTVSHTCSAQDISVQICVYCSHDIVSRVNQQVLNECAAKDALVICEQIHGNTHKKSSLNPNVSSRPLIWKSI